MIVSALSFYDPAHASAVPDYHHPSRWDAPFDPSFSDTANNSLASRDSAFLSSPASPSGDNVQFVHSAAGFGFHRAHVPTHASQSYSQQQPQSAQQHRQIVPIPRRQRGPHYHDYTETHSLAQSHALSSGHGQPQTEQRDQRKAECQVRHSLPDHLHHFNVSDLIQSQENRPPAQELANQRLQELLSLPPSYSYTLQEAHPQSHSTEGQSREHVFSTSEDHPDNSDTRGGPAEYHTQGTSFPSESGFVTAQNAPFPRSTEQYRHSSTESGADVGITVEHVNEPPGMYYNVQSSRSLSSLVRP